jgi:hypothetical protein
MKTLALALLALSCSALAQNNNCSYATMTEVSRTDACLLNGGPYPKGDVVTWYFTWTYDDQCFNDSSGVGVPYFNQTSTVPGYGQCRSKGGTPVSWAYCPAQNEAVEIDAATSNGYNEMDNNSFDFVWYYPDCIPTGFGHQNVKQCAGKGCGTCGNNGGSPIILDVLGEGFHLTSLKDGVTFDILADGDPIGTSWTDPHYHTSFLVHDVPANGKLTGWNLFGNHTHPGCSTGYCALAKFAGLDPAGNGVITSTNPAYSKLWLWDDQNHDGIAQPGELHKLGSQGVYSLSIQAIRSPYKDVYGNQFEFKSKVNPLGQPPTDHVDRTSFDVFFVLAKADPACIY